MWFKRIFLNNLGLKLLALAFATALWFLVVGEKEEEVGFIVPLGFKGIPGDMAMVSNPPGDVEVRVVGPRTFVNNLSPAKITADIDLTDSSEGLNTFHLRPDNIKIPRGIEVTRIRPSSVVVWMEKLLTIKVPVEVRLKGKPGPGYRISVVTVEPREVEVSGITKEIEGLKKFNTLPVAIGGLNFSKSEAVLLEIPNMRFSSVEPDTVVVTVDVEEETKGEVPRTKEVPPGKGG
jgi:YbbR domain-containing protein